MSNFHNAVSVSELIYGPSAETRIQIKYAVLTGNNKEANRILDLLNIAPPLKFVRCANCKDNVEANKPCPMCDKTNEN